MFKLLIAFLLPAISWAQIPNGSFENWTNLNPDGWQINISPPLLMPVIQSSDAHTGSSAMKCEIVDDSGMPFGPYVQPTTSSHGFPYTSNDSVLYGWYKSDLLSSNLGLIEVWVYDSLLNLVGGGLTLLPSTAVYTEFSVPIIYIPGSYAAEMSIIIQMTDTDSLSGFNIGSYFLIDDLSFSHTTTNINTAEKNYYSVSPNPANDFITIHADFTNRRKQYVSIYDVLGKKKISNQIDVISENKSEAIDVSSLEPGNYLMLITDGEHSTTKKIIISR